MVSLHNSQVAAYVAEDLPSIYRDSIDELIDLVERVRRGSRIDTPCRLAVPSVLTDRKNGAVCAGQSVPPVIARSEATKQSPSYMNKIASLRSQ